MKATHILNPSIYFRSEEIYARIVQRCTVSSSSNLRMHGEQVTGCGKWFPHPPRELHWAFHYFIQHLRAWISTGNFDILATVARTGLVNQCFRLDQEGGKRGGGVGLRIREAVREALIGHTGGFVC